MSKGCRLLKEQSDQGLHCLLFPFLLSVHNHDDSKISDRQVLANSVEPDPREQSDQGLHCLPFCLHLSDTLLHGKTTLLKF